METFQMAALPAELRWRKRPAEWALEGEGSLSISAPPNADLFTDPNSGKKTDSAPAALFAPPDENFILSARVRVEFGSLYDAGALFVWVSHQLWGKLCLELSSQREPTIVSVVNRGVSDDCNSACVAGNAAFLRVAQIGPVTVFHWSPDGKSWSLVRYFALEKTDGLRAGFLGQSPTGAGCRTQFSEICYQAGTLRDLWNGE